MTTDDSTRAPELTAHLTGLEQLGLIRAAQLPRRTPGRYASAFGPAPTEPVVVPMPPAVAHAVWKWLSVSV
ncbi:hypothetical protein ACWFPY_24830 [Nocardia fluminea]